MVRKSRHGPTSLMKCVSALPAAPRICARRSGLATKSRRSTPMVRPVVAARSNRRATWLRSPPSCCRAIVPRRKCASSELEVMKLREIAHSRTGDKGDISNISVIAYDEKDYPLALAEVTSARGKAHFAGVVEGDVVRYELPNIFALNFVMDQALGGGVTRSLALDAHGKSLSSALLDLEIEVVPDNNKR